MVKTNTLVLSIYGLLVATSLGLGIYNTIELEKDKSSSVGKTSTGLLSGTEASKYMKIDVDNRMVTVQEQGNVSLGNSTFNITSSDVKLLWEVTSGETFNTVSFTLQVEMNITSTSNDTYIYWGYTIPNNILGTPDFNILPTPHSLYSIIDDETGGGLRYAEILDVNVNGTEITIFFEKPSASLENGQTGLLSLWCNTMYTVSK